MGFCCFRCRSKKVTATSASGSFSQDGEGRGSAREGKVQGAASAKFQISDPGQNFVPLCQSVTGTSGRRFEFCSASTSVSGEQNSIASGSGGAESGFGEIFRFTPGSTFLNYFFVKLVHFFVFYC
jgi:hypothetical protein